MEPENRLRHPRFPGIRNDIDALGVSEKTRLLPLQLQLGARGDYQSLVFTRRSVLQTARSVTRGVRRCGARIAGPKTLPILPFANNAGASLSCFVLPVKRPSVLARGSAESAEPV